MIIRRKIFSEDGSHKIDLKDIKSRRGYGRSAGIGFLTSPYGMGGISGAVGTHFGKEHANKLDKEGLSDEEIEKKSAKRGAIVGGIGGLAASALTGDFALAPISAAGSALGSYLGTKKNTRMRLAERKRLEDSVGSEE